MEAPAINLKITPIAPNSITIKELLMKLQRVMEDRHMTADELKNFTVQDKDFPKEVFELLYLLTALDYHASALNRKFLENNPHTTVKPYDSLDEYLMAALDKLS